MKDYQDEKNQNRQFQQENAGQQSLVESQDYRNYKNLLKKQLNENKADAFTEIITILRQSGITILESEWTIELRAKAYPVTINSQVVQVLARWGKYQMIFQILNVDGSSPMHSNNKKIGGFGSIYFKKCFNKNIAIKCISYKSMKDSCAKLMAIKQYFILKLLSKLKIGPCMDIWFGFDLIMYNECIEFMMEKCQEITHFSQIYNGQLNQSLYKMHLMRIVHFDIKPQNIMFSQIWKKPVFIDFGLSDIINTELGFKSLVSFKGTIHFCSEAMILAFNSKQKQLVDVYYNDAFGLQQSLQHYQKLHKFKLILPSHDYQYFQFSSQGYNDFDCCKHMKQQNIFILYSLKYLLSVGKLKQSTELFQKNIQIIQEYFMIDLLNFIEELYPTKNIRNFYLKQMVSQHKQGVRYAHLNLIYNQKNNISNSLTYKYLIKNQQKKYNFNRYYQNISNIQFTTIQTSSFCRDYLKKQQNVLDTFRYINNFLDYVNFSDNIHGLSMNDRIQAAGLMCFKFCIEIEDTNVLEVMRKCFIKIIEWFLQQISHKNVNCQSQLIVEVIFNIVLQLIQHIFILNIGTQQQLLAWFNHFLTIPYFTLSNQLTILLTINQNCTLFTYRISNKGLHNIWNSISIINKWCFDKLQILKHKDKNCNFQLLIDIIISIISGNFDKKCSTLNITISDSVLKETFIIFYLFNMLVDGKKQFVELQNYVAAIYEYIHPTKRGKMFYFNFWHFKYSLTDQFCQKCLEIIQMFNYNINCQELAQQFILNYASNIQNYSLVSFFIKDLHHILNLLTIECFLKNIQLISTFLKYYDQLLGKIKIGLLQNTQIDKIKQINNKLAMVNSWISAQIVVKLPSIMWPMKKHTCLSYSMIGKLYQIKTMYNYSIQYVRRKETQDLISLKNKANSVQCQKCSFLLLNFSLLTLAQYYSFDQRQMDSQQQLINLHNQIKLLNTNSKFTQYSKLYFYINQHSLSLLCSLNSENQYKYHGVRDFYLFLKKEDKLYNYITNSTGKFRILLTLQIILRDISLDEMTFFLLKLARYFVSNYISRHFHLLLQTYNIFMDNFQDKITPQSIYLSLKSHTNTHSSYMILYYLSIMNRSMKNAQCDISFINKMKCQILRELQQLNEGVHNYFSFHLCKCVLFEEDKKKEKMRKINFIVRMGVKLAVKIDLKSQKRNMRYQNQILLSERGHQHKYKKLKQKIKRFGKIYEINLPLRKYIFMTYKQF